MEYGTAAHIFYRNYEEILLNFHDFVAMEEIMGFLGLMKMNFVAWENGEGNYGVGNSIIASLMYLL